MSSLRALALNCTLKPGPAPSSTGRLLEQLAALDLVISLNLNRGVSPKPPGDVALVPMLNSLVIWLEQVFFHRQHPLV